VDYHGKDTSVPIKIEVTFVPGSTPDNIEAIKLEVPWDDKPEYTCTYRGTSKPYYVSAKVKEQVALVYVAAGRDLAKQLTVSSWTLLGRCGDFSHTQGIRAIPPHPWRLMKLDVSFGQFFRIATGHEPFPFQEKLATGPGFPTLVPIPTGAGKTAGIVLSWIWRRRFAEDGSTGVPRRLVYCLPVRVLVEQTAASAREWVDSLRDKGFPGMERPLPIYVLMGSEEPEDWEMRPEEEAILVGMQDMLLSRALNRGYAASPFRWPREFGLLNKDCLWVFDEVQLMDVGMATSAQLAAFRKRFGTYGPCPSIWMSATLDPEWLRTVDFQPDGKALGLAEADRRHPDLSARRTSMSTCACFDSSDQVGMLKIGTYPVPPQAASRTTPHSGRAARATVSPMSA
jgi:hypothetical protein